MNNTFLFLTILFGLVFGSNNCGSNVPRLFYEDSMDVSTGCYTASGRGSCGGDTNDYWVRVEFTSSMVGTEIALTTSYPSTNYDSYLALYQGTTCPSDTTQCYRSNDDSGYSAICGIANIPGTNSPWGPSGLCALIRLTVTSDLVGQHLLQVKAFSRTPTDYETHIAVGFMSAADYDANAAAAATSWPSYVGGSPGLDNSCPFNGGNGGPGNGNGNGNGNPTYGSESCVSDCYSGNGGSDSVNGDCGDQLSDCTPLLFQGYYSSTDAACEYLDCIEDALGDSACEDYLEQLCCLDDCNEVPFDSTTEECGFSLPCSDAPLLAAALLPLFAF